MKSEKEIRNKYLHVWVDGITTGFDLPESAYESVWDIVRKVAMWTQDSTPTPEPAEAVADVKRGTRYSNIELEQMLEDVVNELNLSDIALQEHGQTGTPPAQLVKLVLKEKDKIIHMLKMGMIDVTLKPITEKVEKSCENCNAPNVKSGVCSKCETHSKWFKEKFEPAEVVAGEIYYIDYDKLQVSTEPLNEILCNINARLVKLEKEKFHAKSNAKEM